MITKTFTCDRCGRSYPRNFWYIFHGPKKPGTITGVSIMGNRTYRVRTLDLCDECVASFFDWYTGKGAELPEYIEGAPFCVSPEVNNEGNGEGSHE